MKTTTRQVKPSKRATIVKGFDPDADDIASRYYEEKGHIKDCDGRIAKLREEIDELIATKGIQDGNTLLVKGNKYAVGVTTVMASPSLDSDALYAELARLGNKVLKQVFKQVVTNVLIEDEFIKAVEAGEIPRPLVDKFTTPSVPKGERLSITKL